MSISSSSVASPSIASPIPIPSPAPPQTQHSTGSGSGAELKEGSPGSEGIGQPSAKTDPPPLPPRHEAAERDRSASPTSISKASDVLKEVVARDSEERARRESVEREREKEDVLVSDS